MKLLDLFCGGGGAAMGYYQAGFTDITGIDINPQKHYPFKFIQADALEYLAEYGAEYDVIHASPPCQLFSRIQSLGIARNGTYREHPNLIPPTRELLLKIGKHFVIENVIGAPLINPIILCGSMFDGLRVYRHRQFESNYNLISKIHIPHKDHTPSAGNGKSPKGFISVCGSGGVKGMNSKEIVEYWSMAMGINWMTREELSQAIPPAYTKFIGEQLTKVPEN
jgi:DNA (cytosine-5)-methyltransferase 1